MKKNKLFKRFLTLVMACLMTFGASASVFAAEPTVAEPVNVDLCQVFRHIFLRIYIFFQASLE